MTAISRTSPEAKLERYHPIRFFLMRDDDDWIDMAENHAADQADDPLWRTYGVGERIYWSHLNGTNLLKGLEPYTFHEDRLKKAFDESYGEAGNTVEGMVSSWREAGEQIFDVSAIAAMFLGSNALKTPVGQLQLPYECFFVHWGKHLQLMSPMNGRFIEGCYVDRYSDGPIDIGFVCSLPDNEPWDERSLLANLVVDYEGVFAVLVTPNEDGTINDALSENMQPGCSNEPAVLRWAPYIEPAVNMAANCLCYLSSPSADIDDTYPSEAPSRLVKQAVAGTPSERKRGASKLQNLGFRTIKLCGRRLAESLGIKPGSKEMPPHWRRGHWWPARVGKGRTAIRMDWRNGVVVNADKGSPDGGHIYQP
jgi:hypothetical protein